MTDTGQKRVPSVPFTAQLILLGHERIGRHKPRERRHVVAHWAAQRQTLGAERGGRGQRIAHAG